MAMIRNNVAIDIASAAEPWWDEETVSLAEPPARYGAFADELVVRFLAWSSTPVETVPLAVPDQEYTGVIAESETGRVVGIQIDAREIAGVRDHPHWSALLRPDPPREAVAALVAEVHALFDRFGVPPA